MKYAIRDRLIAGILVLFALLFTVGYIPAYAAEASDSTRKIRAMVYELDENVEYHIENGAGISKNVNRFSVSGPISTTSKNGNIVSYGVDVDLDEKLTVTVTDSLLSAVGKPNDGWESKDDGAKIVESSEIGEKIKSGAIIVQTSRDGRIWITDKTYADVFNSTLPEYAESGKAFYETTAAQLNNGCFYRIIVAYKLQHRVEDKKITFVSVPNYEVKRYMEVYEFYAYNINSDMSEELNEADAYKLGDSDYLVRCANDEYSGSYPIDNADPHSSWEIGKFYISGYTDKTEWSNDNTPIFLKTVGDKVTLWFNLEQDISRCNGRDAIKVVADTDGSDQSFNTPRMDFGRGMLIVKKTDEHNGKSIQYYRDYLAASATPGANTKIELLEEGDYEIALDYALEHDKTKLFGRSVLPKTLHYRVYFKFSVRNGDSKVFVRDAVTNAFIDNANIAENGFYLDLARQQYLTLTLKREVMTDSLDGLVPDTKFNGAAKEGRMYTDEGIYTITATNKYTSAETVKRVYVGNSDILKAYTKEGNTYTIAELNEMIANGAYVENDGTLVLPAAVEDAPTADVIIETTESQPEEIVTKEGIPEDAVETVPVEETVKINEESAQQKSSPAYIIAGLAAIVLILLVILSFKRKKNKSRAEGE